MSSHRILIISTPVGPLGSGTGGGVELTLHSLVLGLTGRGHRVEVLAPAGSLHVGAVAIWVGGLIGLLLGAVAASVADPFLQRRVARSKV